MVEVVFLNRNQTKEEFKKSKYLQTISSRELNIRRELFGNTANTRVDLMQYYYKSVREFAYEEKEKLEIIVKNALELLNKKFPNITHFIAPNNKIFLGKVEGTLDWHFPYTLNMTIILPINIINEKSQDELTSTMIHEMIHLHQKTQPNFYEEIYKNNFGFEKINPEKIIITSNYENKLITNPDALKREWVIQLYDGLYLPALIYLQQRHYSCLFRLKKSLNEGYYVAEEDPIIAHSRSDYIQMVQGCKEQLDHPNEIIACIIASSIFKK